MIWFIPVFFAAFGVPFLLFARSLAGSYYRMRRRKGISTDLGEWERGTVQVRQLGGTLLVTAAVFAVLILGGLLR